MHVAIACRRETRARDRRAFSTVFIVTDEVSAEWLITAEKGNELSRFTIAGAREDELITLAA